MSLHLGLDVGTQGTKGLVLDGENSRILARASVSYGLIEGLPEGAAEQHPQTWVDAIAQVCAELLGSPGVDPQGFASVGVSGQQHGLVVLDAKGQVLRAAKLWCDTATAPEARELAERLGRPMPTGFTASKILWLMRHEPEVWDRVAQVLLPHDYINYVLTGNASMEAGDASGTGLLDVRTREFRQEDLDALDPRLPSLLPPILPAGAVAGHLDERGAQLLGLPEGVLVSTGGGDNMMSAVGSGATEPGVAVASLGTSGTVFCHSDAPRVDPDGLIAPFCDSVGGWLPLLCVMNLTSVAEEVCASFSQNHGSLTEAASSVPVGCDGLLWLPYLAGERVPDLPTASGTLLGIRPGHLRAEVLYRAALEGTSLNLAWGVERMRRLGLPVASIHLVGGAAQNALWCRILADTLNCPVTPLAELESAALGAALHGLWTWKRAEGSSLSMAALATPWIETAGPALQPNEARVQQYAELGDRFRLEVSRVYS